MNGIEYDQYRPALLFKNKLALIHVLLDSFVVVTSPISNDVHVPLDSFVLVTSPISNDGLSVN
jgi:hypothetical protein